MMAEVCQSPGWILECQLILALSIVVPIFKWKGDVSNCSCYWAVKLLVHGMNVVERLL